MLAALVDTHALLKVIVYALVTTVGLSLVFSLGIVGVTRYDERRQSGSGGGAGYALLALVSGLIVAAVLVEAIVIMAKK